MSIPRIDPAIQYIGLSALRLFNKSVLRKLKGIMVVQDGSRPLAVIVPYETYLQLQNASTKGESDEV